MIRYWYLFMRYQLAVDLYLARIGGNGEAASYAANRISEIDRQLDRMAIQ